MQSKLYIGIANPADFYFVDLPVESKCTLPASAIYTYIELRQFLTRLIEKYPGTLRDLAAAVNTQPHYLFEFARSMPDPRPKPSFSDLLTHDSITQLIKYYYKYILASNPNIIHN